MHAERRNIQRLAEVGAPGMVNFVTAVAYHLCSSLPAAFTQPGGLTLANLCTQIYIKATHTPTQEYCIRITTDCISSVYHIDSWAIKEHSEYEQECHSETSKVREPI